MLLNILVLSISLSIDALGIGISYQCKKVKITWLARIIIGFISGMVMFLSLQLGEVFQTVFPEPVMKILGISILALMGIIFIRNGLFHNDDATYDFDHSSNIDAFEAFVLGFALSADSVSAGVAAASIGINTILIPITVGLMQMFFLGLGAFLTDKSSFIKRMNQKTCGILSGCLLLIIALIRGIG